MNRNCVFLLLTIALTFSSCSYRLFDFTIVSSKNVSIDIDMSHAKRTEASDNGFLGLGANVKDAMDKALEAAGPEYDLLIDGVVRFNDYFFVCGYKVVGTAVSSKKLRASLGDKGFEEWCKSNNVFDPENVTEIAINK